MACKLHECQLPERRLAGVSGPSVTPEGTGERLCTSSVAAQVFESERCDFCFLPVELPSIHFRCGHSFHIYCLSSPGDSKTGVTDAAGSAQVSYCCAICTPQFNAKRVCTNKRTDTLGMSLCTTMTCVLPWHERFEVACAVLQLLLSQREAEAGNTDDFFRFLRGSTDGFDFILSCFGRGLFPSPLVRGSVPMRES